MKPFDLEAALRGEKVVIKTGQEVFDLRHSKHVEGKYCLSGVVGGEFHSWSKDGKFTENESMIDLFMAPNIIKRWVNFYDQAIYASVYETEEDAKKRASESVARSIAIAVPVEFEEGYGK